MDLSMIYFLQFHFFSIDGERDMGKYHFVVILCYTTVSILLDSITLP